MKGIVKVCVVWAAFSLTPAITADFVSAAAPEPAPEAGWTYSVPPYFWEAGLSGETSQFGLPVVDMDAGFRTSSTISNSPRCSSARHATVRTAFSVT